jgi:hypothetical protein
MKLLLRMDGKRTDASQLRAYSLQSHFTDVPQNFDDTFSISYKVKHHPNAYASLQTKPNRLSIIQSRIDFEGFCILRLQPLAVECIDEPVVKFWSWSALLHFAMVSPKVLDLLS